ALTASNEARNQMCLSWGVLPYNLLLGENVNDLIKRIKILVIEKKLVKRGDVVIIAASHPFGFIGQTNLIKVETI
ncbi:MAG: pyruvate kinase alpha/beta domain-containing protein, partial [Candidatus Buchananbacteria bacterium]